MADPKQPPALIDDLLPGEGLLDASTVTDASESEDRFDAALDAPLDAALPPEGEPPVRLPATVLIVDEDRRRGARTAARLMEHGYTCRVVPPAELASAASAQRFDAALVELGGAGRDPEDEVLAARVVGGPVVVSVPEGARRPSSADAILDKPWLTAQAVLAIETVRSEPLTALDGPTVAATAPPSPAPTVEHGPPTPIIEHSPPRTVAPTAEEPEGWERFDRRVVRARLFELDGERFTPGRIVRCSDEGAMEVATRSPWPAEARLTVELALVTGHRQVFPGVVTSSKVGLVQVALGLGAHDVPFFHAWMEEVAGSPPSEPVRLRREEGEGPRPDEVPHPRAAPGPVAPASLEALWTEARSALDDDEKQQRFIQGCLAEDQIELAVRRYRGLKEANPDDPRPQRYLSQVGTILGFYALRQAQADPLGAAGGKSALKLALGAFVVTAVGLAVMAWLMR